MMSIWDTCEKSLEVKTSIILRILHIGSNDTIEDLYFDFHQSVPITTKVVNSNPTHGEVYSIQHYVINFVSDLRKVSGFLRFLPPIKLTSMIDITVIQHPHLPSAEGFLPPKQALYPQLFIDIGQIFKYFFSLHTDLYVSNEKKVMVNNMINVINKRTTASLLKLLNKKDHDIWHLLSRLENQNLIYQFIPVLGQ